jgi:drug/metabolite transporter (DMT)-like permease
MHIPPWFWYVAVVLIFWGGCGIFQKLATNRISAESSLIWLIVGFVLLEPLVYPGRALLHYSKQNIMWGLLSGALSNLGAWGLYAAMKSGGKASIVAPFCALYPLVVVVLAPILLHESITKLQGLGVICGLVAVVLLSV